MVDYVGNAGTGQGALTMTGALTMSAEQINGLANGAVATDAATLQQAYEAYYVNVKDPNYGAKGDGSTDDTMAITNAINALGAVGGTVYFPPGTYCVYSSGGVAISVPKYVRLLGTGSSRANPTPDIYSTIVLHGTASETCLVQLNGQYATLESMNVDGGGVHVQNPIQINCSDARIINCGIYGPDGSTSSYTVKCITSAADKGFIIGSYISASVATAACIYQEGADWQVVATVFEGGSKSLNGGTGFWSCVHFSSATTGSPNVEVVAGSHVFSGCHFDSTPNDLSPLLQLDSGAFDVLVTGSRFYNSGSVTPGPAIDTYSTYPLTVDGVELIYGTSAFNHLIKFETGSSPALTAVNGVNIGASALTGTIFSAGIPGLVSGVLQDGVVQSFTPLSDLLSANVAVGLCSSATIVSVSLGAGTWLVSAMVTFTSAGTSTTDIIDVYLAPASSGGATATGYTSSSLYVPPGQTSCVTLTAVLTVTTTGTVDVVCQTPATISGTAVRHSVVSSTSYACGINAVPILT